MGLVYKDLGAQSIIDEEKGMVSSDYRDSSNSFNLQYPNNIETSPEYGGNKMVFFINVRGNSKLATGKSSSVDARNSTSDLPIEQGKAGAGAQEVGGAVLNEAASLLSGSVGAKLEQVIPRPMKRLNACIVLYMPNTLSVSSNVLYQETDFSDGQMTEQFLTAGINAIKNNSSVLGMAGDAFTGAMKATGSAVATKILGQMKYGQKVFGMTPGNAKEEQLFQGVGFRNYTFDFDFAPKTPAESKTVLDIIRMFKHHMLPEFLDENKFIYIFPSEFEIRYYKGSKENTHLERQMTTVLTSVNVNYTPNNQFNTFEDGMPSHIRLSLQFKEVGLLSKETSPYDKPGL